MTTRRSSLIFCVPMVCFGTLGLYNIYATYVSLTLLLLWLTTIIMESYKSSSGLFVDKTTAAFMVFILFVVLTGLFEAGIAGSLKNCISRLILLSPVLILINYWDTDDFIKITKWAIGTWDIVCIFAIWFYSVNPHAARIIAFNRSYYGDIPVGGGYSLAYGASLIAVSIFGLLLQRDSNSSIKRPALLVTFVLCCIVVFQTASTITIIALVAGIVYAIILAVRPKHINVTYVLFITILLIAFAAILINWKRIGLYIISQTSGDSDILKRRFQEIGQAMVGNNSNESDLSYRVESIIGSLRIFFKHPLFGCGVLFGYDFASSVEFGVGNHGEFADTLAMYGLIGGFPLLYCFGAPYRFLKGTVNHAVIKILLLTFAILFIFNPFITFQSCLAFFVIVPGIICNGFGGRDFE